MHTWILTYIHTYAYVHTYIHTYIRMYLHTYMILYLFMIDFYMHAYSCSKHIATYMDMYIRRLMIKLYSYVLSNILIIILANGQTIHISGNQTVAEGTNVTFSCIVTSDRPMRSNWLIIFPNDRNLNNIRLQGGNYTPSGTDTSLFHVPDLYPGVQEEFTFVRISSIFDMAKVQCFNGGAQNSSFIDVISMFPYHPCICAQ